MFCLNASGGTGKTYVVNMILAKVRSMQKIALATAMSGIAATLLDNGRTLHSRLKIPLDMKEESVCNFSRRYATGKLLQMTSLLVIDEVSMGHKHIFECVDRSLRDIRQVDAPFGGLTVLLAGDRKQILPVVGHGGRPEIVEATLKRSYIWPKILPLPLSTNMRVSNAAPDSGAQESSEYLQDVGSGTILLAGVGDVGPNAVAVPSEFKLETTTMSNLCDFVFHDLDNHFQNADWLASRAIIAPTNKAVDEINTVMMDRFPGQERVYNCSDTVDNEHHYPVEFINRLTPSGFPPHELRVKRDSCIMILRNFDAAAGHCNGTRYIVLQTGNHIIEAVIAAGPHAGENCSFREYR